DFNFPTAIEGRVVPLIWGTVKLDGPNVVWYGDFRQKKIKEKVKTGLWTSESFIKGFRYFIGFQVAMCRGQIDSLRRIWIGETVVFSGSIQDGTVTIDDPKLFGGEDFGQGGVQGDFTVHSGSESQLEDPYLEDFQSPTPAYRGTFYGVWEGGYLGNSTNIRPWSFEASRFPNGLAISGGHHIVNTFDSNPMAVIYEVLTNDEWGFGFTSSDVDLIGFRTVADTLFNEGNGFSFLLDNPIEALDLLNEIERQIDATVYYDRSTSQWRVNLLRSDYDINTIPQVDSTSGPDMHVIEVRDFTRGTWDETVNAVRVKFSDRSRDYFETFAVSPDLANHQIQGGQVVQVEMVYPGVKDKDLSAQIAAREMRMLSVPLSKATVVVDRTFYNLTPGVPVAFTDPNFGFTQLPMRVAGVDFGDLEDGRITLTLIQDVFRLATAITAPPDDTLWTPPTQDVV
ncbi:MAG: phage tail protein, partial [bacterium]